MPARGRMRVTGVDESTPIFVDTPRGRFAYCELGPESPVEDSSASGDVPPLVLVHGFTGHRDDFIGVMPKLAGRRRVLALDLRGHGDSVSDPAGSGWDFEALVLDLEAFLDALALSRIDLLGHSMGGFVTLRFALAHAARVRSLLFLCTGPETPASISKDGFLKAAEIAMASGMDAIQVIVEKVGRATASPTVVDWGERYWTHHRRRLCAMTPASYAGLGRAFFESASLRDRLGEIEIQTCVLVGEHDADFLAGADAFEIGLPHVLRWTIPEAEHHPHNENEAAFLMAVEGHLDLVDALDGARPKEE